MLTRIQDPSFGTISIDNLDIQSVNLDSLRKNIGVVSQDGILFHSSCGDNIRYGNLNASSEEVESAARLACISDVIKSFEKGYDTSVGERGMKV